MPPSPPPLKLTEEQVLFFRARRGHIAGRGAPDVVAAGDQLGLEGADVKVGS